MFVLDDNARVLLMHERRDIGSASTHWITPGGGVESGETLVEAAIREVFEETGLRLELACDALPIYSESVVFSFIGVSYDQLNHYFLFRVPAGLVVEPAEQTQTEHLVVLGHRWWTLAELDASDEVREPVAMVELIRTALAGSLDDDS
jgi:8-oxo-dGTP pyrophosphatase MutT (NUDIX family)